MGIMTWQDMPVQEENASPYNLPNSINPVRGVATQFGLDVLNLAGTFATAIQANTQNIGHATDGLFSEQPQVSAPLTADQKAQVKQFYPDLLIGKEASREQVEAAIDRTERERAGEYLDSHISPGFAGDAALFTGQVGASLLNYPALKGAQWASKGIQKASELLAEHVGASAVSRLGGTLSVKAQQLLADNAGKIGFAKSGAGLATFEAIQEGMSQGAARQSGVMTPNEADFGLMDGVFNVASSGLVGGVLGLAAEKATGKLVDKSFIARTAEEKAASKNKSSSLPDIDDDVVEKDGDYLYRGSRKKYFDFRRYPDKEFDKGFWFGESKAHAEYYGKHVSKIKNSEDFKIFDVNKNDDPELTELYKELHENAHIVEVYQHFPTKGSTKARYDEARKNRPKLVNEFLAKVKEKGYIGLRRKEGFHDDFGRNTTAPGEKPKRKDETMFFEDPVKKLRAAQNAERFTGITKMYTADFGLGEVSEKFEKAASVVKAFFQSAKESTERETMDNVSQAFEAGKEPHSDYIHEVNRHDAWQRLQGYLNQANLTPDEFAEALKENHAEHVELLKAMPEDGEATPEAFDAAQQVALHEALIDLASKTEADVMPLDETKKASLNAMQDNSIKFDDREMPYIDLNAEKPEPREHLQSRLDAFSVEEMEGLAEDKANVYARNALKRRNLLDYEQPLSDFFSEYGNQIASEINSGVELTPEYLKSFFDFLAPDGLPGIEELLDANKYDVDFMLDNIRMMLEDLEKESADGQFNFTPEKLQEMMKRQFDYVKAQVIRSQRDAVAFDAKLKLFDSVQKVVADKGGNSIKQWINALLDRSLFQFKGANTGTYRKMNIAEQNFRAQLTYELNEAKVMEFFNDTNSSTEITEALYKQDMGMPMDDVSPAAKKVAEIVNKFYDTALDAYAKEGVLIPKLKGRIHYQWHNPYRILKLPFRDRIKLSRLEARDKAFDRWYDFIKDRIDLQKTFLDQVGLEDDPAIDINDPVALRQAFRNTFEKIVERDFRREKSNIMNRRSRRRVYQFKTPEDFAAYNRMFGAGDAQSSVIRELNGMFREVELVKDWGVEPEKMLDEVMKHAENLPGWKEYKAESQTTRDTPKRLMHMMRFGAASSGTMFSEMIHNLKAYESVTKLGNLLFLNLADGMVAANALNRFSIPMQESILKGLKETFSRYTPEQEADYQRMFNISKHQYMGGYYRHFEDGTLSSTLSKAIRLTMKITGTENSEYSNRSMIGQSLSNWFATNLKRHEFNNVDTQSRNTMKRYGIGEKEWRVMRKAVTDYQGNDYLGWDNIHELSDEDIITYLKSKGVTDPTADRIEITRDDIAQRYRLLMQDQMDDALNRKSLIESDLLRFRRPTDKASAIDDTINGMMLFKTYGFMWIRRHVGDRIYGRGASGYRTSQIQGTADWHGLMKLIGYSFGMELAINQMKSLANDQKPLPLDGKTAFDALMGSLGPLSYVSRVEGQNFTSSLAKMLAGPIGGDLDRLARIVQQFEKGYWKGDYTNAQVNSIKFLASQFGGVPMLKPALNTLLFDNMIQNIKGRRTGHVIDSVAANQPEQ